MAVGLGGSSSGLDYFARGVEDVQHIEMIYSSFLLETDTGDVKRPGHNHCGPTADVFSGVSCAQSPTNVSSVHLYRYRAHIDRTE